MLIYGEGDHLAFAQVECWLALNGLHGIISQKIGSKSSNLRNTSFYEYEFLRVAVSTVTSNWLLHIALGIIYCSLWESRAGEQHFRYEK
jgi:hypothetical protein